ncbi:MAG: MarR family winged helix-turn-helix transcriptional regulator [Alphaproteobacteria bacterium]|nr:MarR family winged helix-turn-helix transcriptional regulator [Alphaproteobacteria bacterium]
MDSRVIAELILHLGRIASGDGLVGGLTPVQWTGLRYFARANRFSRTPSAFAAFHGTTRGTASQTIKGLVAEGYLKQSRSKTDGRSVRLDLTEKARALLSEDPIETLVRAADALPPGVHGSFSVVLRRLLGSVALETGKPLFGTCETCVHFAGDGCCREGMPAYECGFVKEALTAEELEQLCINFESGKSGPARNGTAWR